MSISQNRKEMKRLKSQQKPSNKVLFIGNGINNLNNKESWGDLLKKLSEKVNYKENLDDLSKEFPLVYENLLLYGLRFSGIYESDLKTIIAQNIDKIAPNDIHKRIDGISPKHIITTNYDYTLESGNDWLKTSLIDEKRFSIFRCNTDSWKDRNIWHIHGDLNNPHSINLGYEHYCGQLQMLRNYVVTGPQYSSKKVNTIALEDRLDTISDNPDSWVDLLFSNEVHIIGLSLNFIEIDLWWLLTYRAKLIIQKDKKIKNEIFYYIPAKYYFEAKGKIGLLRNMGIQVVSVDKTDYDFYNAVFDGIEDGTTNSVITH
jgi:hypothetical protein